MKDAQTLAYEAARAASPKSTPMDDYARGDLLQEDKDMLGLPAESIDDYMNSVGVAETQGARNSLLGSGYASAKGNFWKGAGASLNILEDSFGFETNADEKMLEWSSTNLNDANADRDGLVDDVIFTAGQIGLPIATTLTAAAVAPFVGLSAVVGAGVAGFATAWGMNAGDFYSKEEAEDPDYKPGLADFAITGLLAAPEAIPIGRGLKLFKPLGEAVATTATKTAAEAGMDVAQVASKLPNYTGDVAKIALETGAVEGVQDFSGSIAAALMTDSELDAEKVGSLARSSAYEALVGGILGVPLGGLSVNAERAGIKQAEQNANYIPQEAIRLVDDEGNLSEDFTNLVPVSGSPKQPGFFSLAAQTLVGNATSKMKDKLAWSPKAQALLQNFNINFKERGPGKRTINEKARALEGELQTLARAFNKSSLADRKAAWDAKAEGVQLDTPASKALFEMLNVKIPELTNSLSRGVIATDIGLFVDNTYLPLNNNFDYAATIKDASFLEKAAKDMEANGKSPKEIESTLEVLRQQQESYQATGNHMSYAMDKKNDVFQAKLFKSIEKAKSKGKSLTKKQQASLKSRLMKEAKADTKQSPLTLDRSLKNLSQSFLNSYSKTDDPRSAVNSHIRMVSEHLATVDSLGVNNAVFDEAVIDIALDAYNTGNEFTAADMDAMYDIVRTQQRIHLKPLQNESVRKAQNSARAVVNTMLLGLSVLVSIPESLVIFMNTGGKAGLQGLVQTMMQGMNLREAGIASEQLGYTINTAIDHGINRTGEESYEVGTFEQAFIRWTGLPYLQHFLTVWAARANDVHVKDMLRQMNTENISVEKRNHYIRKLNEAGIDVDKALDWANKDYPQDSEYFKKEYVPAIIGLTQDTIVDPHPIDKPLWMNDERLLLLTQLKGFMTVFTNRVMGGWSRKVAASPEGNRQLATKVAPYVAMYISAQVAMQAVREVIKSGDLEDWDETEMSDRILSAFGYLGGMSYFIDTYNSLRFNSDPTAALAGPVPSKLLNVAGVTVDAIDRSDPEAIVEGLIKELFPNVPFKTIMLEALGVE